MSSLFLTLDSSFLMCVRIFISHMQTFSPCSTIGEISSLPFETTVALLQPIKEISIKKYTYFFALELIAYNFFQYNVNI